MWVKVIRRLTRSVPISELLLILLVAEELAYKTPQQDHMIVPRKGLQFFRRDDDEWDTNLPAQPNLEVQFQLSIRILAIPELSQL